MSDARILIEMFHDPVKLGHYLVYKFLEKERDALFEKIVQDYEITPMDRYELEQTILSPHYLQIHFPNDEDEHYDSVRDHVKRKNKLSRTC